MAANGEPVILYEPAGMLSVRLEQTDRDAIEFIRCHLRQNTFWQPHHESKGTCVRYALRMCVAFLLEQAQGTQAQAQAHYPKPMYAAPWRTSGESHHEGE